jgi:hypothetical protein
LVKAIPGLVDLIHPCLIAEGDFKPHFEHLPFSTWPCLGYSLHSLTSF